MTLFFAFLATTMFGGGLVCFAVLIHELVASADKEPTEPAAVVPTDEFEAHCASPAVALVEWSPFSPADQDWLARLGVSS